MDDSSSDDDFVNSRRSSCLTQKPATPSSSSKRKAATPTSSKKSKPKKKKDDDEEEKVPELRFVKLDSDDDDDEEELTSKMEWMMVESKVDGTRYAMGPPTNPNHRYVNRKIQTREEKPVPVWCKITQSLSTKRKMADKSEDENESKLREFYCELAREGNDEDMPSQESTTSELTPLTPEVVTGKYPPLTANERTIAETKIRAAGQEGLLVPGLTSRVAYSLPNLNRDYGLFVTLPLNTRSRARFICAAEPNCVRTKATLMEEVTKCDIHKGERIGFVLSQFTDGANMKNNVILHTIASFTYISGDQEGKARNAGTATTSTINNNVYGSWKVYTKEREAAKKPTPELIEIETRRRYFDDEYEMMKVYSARQTTTLFQMLLWPETTIKIISLNTMVNFPNGAYRELVEEMDLCSVELRIQDKISPAAAELKSGLEIPFLLKPEQGESLWSLLARGSKKNEEEENVEKMAALYFVSSPFVIYAGQTISAIVHTISSGRDPVMDYKGNKGNHPDYKIIPIGLVLEKERYKWEFHLHMCALIASLLKLKNCINPADYSSSDPHPLCINRQTNSSFIDKQSWGIIHGYMMKKFLVNVYLGPKVLDQ